MGSEDTAVGSLTGPRDRSTFRCARSPSRSPDAVPPYRRHRWLTLLPLVLAACGGPFPQSALHPESDYARSLDALFHGIFWWAVLVFVLVESLLLFILLRYRQRAGAATPKPTHGHTVLEIAWTLAPALILVFIAVPTMRTIFATQQPPAFNALRIEVIGTNGGGSIATPPRESSRPTSCTCRSAGRSTSRSRRRTSSTASGRPASAASAI
ncbi:MAG: hypothetical protein DMD71_06115 [Gemmatimonadetes bacterium]|nr:MAG: hypothetical protein DMD71_06115 [Gemmatimonadota bacterium]